MHLQHSAAAILAVASCAQASAAAILAVASCAQAISPSNVTSIPKSSLFERRNPPYFNDEDLSFIKKIAAIGDSYSAGIGAGDRLGGDGDWSCSRYSESYPMLFNEDERFGDSKDRKFQFKSCSGAVVKDVLDNQIPEISDGQDVILLSAGGNDAELSNILNQCIFQWNVDDPPDEQRTELKRQEWLPKDFDFNAFAYDCESQLKKTGSFVQSSEFDDRLDKVISAAKEKLASGGAIYYTGYAKFFNQDTPECDAVDWTIWAQRYSSVPRAKLTRDRRRKMNDLVDAVNSKLKAAVKRAGSSVEFVDFDEYVEYFNGRFCEPGVDESSDESNTRFGLMFYELNTNDFFGESPWKRGEHTSPQDSFEGTANIYGLIHEFLYPKDTLIDSKRIDDSKSASSAALLSAQAKEGTIQVRNVMPDGFLRVFHPQVLLHNIIANLLVFRVTQRREREIGLGTFPEIWDKPLSCPIEDPPSDEIPLILKYKRTPPGKQIKKGVELRILPVGDSITVGFLSDRDGGDGNGYRGKLQSDLSRNKVVFAGTESTDGDMADGYFAAWSGKTIQYAADHVKPSLEQRPNVVLVALGTNDMNPSHSISTEGNDPAGAADRLGKLIDQIIDKCPDATVLVSIIIGTDDPNQSERTKQYQKLIPGVVKQRKDRGKHVLAADFSGFDVHMLRDHIHPTNDGYKLMGDMWYDFVTQIPSEWIKDPVGRDPARDNFDSEIRKNGGLDTHIPPPLMRHSQPFPFGYKTVEEGYDKAVDDGPAACKQSSIGRYTLGKIASGGVGHSGDWKYHKDWQYKGKVADGLGWGNEGVRLHDMNGDGKADYVWIHPQTGEIRCWLNNLPEPWSPAGTNNSIIGSGVGPRKTIFLADMNGDGMDDYLVVDGDNGSVRIWWNGGPDKDWVNGWKFEAGGVIATGVPHANLATLRFPDINGDGRADYVYIGKGGSLKYYENIGTVDGKDPVFYDRNGIATGAVSDISKLVFADINGDGRDDYLIWDNEGGLSGFLNKPMNREDSPIYIDQGGSKVIADGVHQKPESIRLADMDGDGKDDYVFIGDHGSLKVWYNRGTTDDVMASDYVHFASLSGKGVDDYVWVDPKTGAPTVYFNKGPNEDDVNHWLWDPQNGGKPIASGAGLGHEVKFGDINGDGFDDYLVIDSKTGKTTAYLFEPDKEGEEQYGKFLFKPVGVIASGLGPGKNVRIADIDGDGRDDYIYLNETGGAIVYRNLYGPQTGPKNRYLALPGADAFGIHQSPGDIVFHDLDGDGKADYIWLQRLTGKMSVWFNRYPQLPAWDGPHEPHDVSLFVGDGKFAFPQLAPTGRADIVTVDVDNGQLGGFVSICKDGDYVSEPKTSNRVSMVLVGDGGKEGRGYYWLAAAEENGNDKTGALCEDGRNPEYPSEVGNNIPAGGTNATNYPPSSPTFKAYGHDCFYVGTHRGPGHMYCDGVGPIKCEEYSDMGKIHGCKKHPFRWVDWQVYCEW